MKALISLNKRTERVFLIALELKSESAWSTRESLAAWIELAGRTNTSFPAADYRQIVAKEVDAPGNELLTARLPEGGK